MLAVLAETELRKARLLPTAVRYMYPQRYNPLISMPLWSVVKIVVLPRHLFGDATSRVKRSAMRVVKQPSILISRNANLPDQVSTTNYMVFIGRRR